MKAVVIARLGGPEVLEVRDMPEPQPKPGEVIVRVEAVGINFADTMTTRGTYGGMPPPPFISGREFAGVVETTGERVMGYMQWGAAAAEDRDEAQAPMAAARGLEFGTVGGLSGKFPDRLSGLLEGRPDGRRARTDPVDRQPQRPRADSCRGRRRRHRRDRMGKLLGIETYGTSSSEEKLERVKKLGLDHGINYREVDYEQRVKELTNGEGVDAVFEMLGGEHTAKSLRCCRPFGRVIIYGTATGQRHQFDSGVMMAKSLSAHGLWLSVLAKDRDLIDRTLQRHAALDRAGQAASRDRAHRCPWSRPAKRIACCCSALTTARLFCGSDKPVPGCKAGGMTKPSGRRQVLANSGGASRHLIAGDWQATAQTVCDGVSGCVELLRLSRRGPVARRRGAIRYRLHEVEICIRARLQPGRMAPYYAAGL